MANLMHIATNDPALDELLHWRSLLDGTPDVDSLVLVYCPDSDEPVWPGYFDGEVWRHAEGGRCDVTFWAPMPIGPTF